MRPPMWPPWGGPVNTAGGPVPIPLPTLQPRSSHRRKRRWARPRLASHWPRAQGAPVGVTPPGQDNRTTDPPCYKWKRISEGQGGAGLVRVTRHGTKIQPASMASSRAESYSGPGLGSRQAGPAQRFGRNALVAWGGEGVKFRSKLGEQPVPRASLRGAQCPALRVPHAPRSDGTFNTVPSDLGVSHSQALPGQGANAEGGRKVLGGRRAPSHTWSDGQHLSGHRLVQPPFTEKENRFRKTLTLERPAGTGGQDGSHQGSPCVHAQGQGHAPSPWRGAGVGKEWGAGPGPSQMRR